MEDFAYAYAGTCFPIKYYNRLFIVSAKHCFSNHSIDPIDMLYPNPKNIRENLDYIKKYDIELDKSEETFKEVNADDIVIVEVLESKTFLIRDIDALDISKDNNMIKMSINKEDIKELYLRGFPFETDKHEILYDENVIRQRAYVTNGFKSIRKSEKYDFCFEIKFIEPIPEGINANGISGSPIYGLVNNEINFVGMVLAFNSITNIYYVLNGLVIKQYFDQLIKK